MGVVVDKPTPWAPGILAVKIIDDRISLSEIRHAGGFDANRPMNSQHPDLATGRWGQFSFLEQMANIGSEVERALNWKNRQNPDYSRKAFERALELTDLSLAAVRGGPRLKEIARMREMLVDYFNGDNEYQSTESAWRKYFLAFTYAARRNR